MSASWDVAEARRLYDADLSLNAIAKALRVSKNSIAKYADRHWPKRAVDSARQEQYFHPKSAKPGQAKRVRPGTTTLPPLASLDPNNAA